MNTWMSSGTGKFASEGRNAEVRQLTLTSRRVFVHRYRDKDAAIRSDCLVMLGRFIDAYPRKFQDTTHLQYVDWALTDSVGHRDSIETRAAEH
jgi:hypothetical protein